MRGGCIKGEKRRKGNDGGSHAFTPFQVGKKGADKIQTELKAEMLVVNLHKLPTSHAKQRKMWDNILAVNDARRDDMGFQFLHSCVNTETLKAVKHAMLSHVAARARNQFNRENGIPLRWARGKQVIT